MAARSALQMRKEAEQLHRERVAETLRRQTGFAEAKAKAEQIDPKAVGYALYEAYKTDALRHPDTFKRPLKTRNKRSIILAYALHMFGDYPVAPFIQNAFVDARQNPVLNSRHMRIDDLIAIMLFMAVRSGKSVYREVTSDYLSKKETHTLVNCPHDFTMREAFIYALACSDTDRGNAHRIAKSRLSQVYSYGDKFWRDVIRFFARNPVTKAEIGDLVDFLRHKHQENPNYTIKGRSVANLKRGHEEWIREMGRMKILGSHTWDGLNYKDLEFKTRDGKHGWYLFQIKSSKELGREGTTMRHCVLSYRARCSDGHIGIFSLRWRDAKGPGAEHQPYQKCMTIEVTRDGNIVQVRGFANRLPEEFEREAVAYWAAQNGIIYNRRNVW